jgi:hypothetical protein
MVNERKMLAPINDTVDAVTIDPLVKIPGFGKAVEVCRYIDG